MYAIIASYEVNRDGWKSSRWLPSFYLNESVQGIVSEEHAKKIAADIIDPCKMLEGLKIDAWKVAA